MPISPSLSLLAALNIHVVQNLPPTIDVSVSARTDEVNWSIAGNTRGRNPNILSELTWDGLRTMTVGVRSQYQYQWWLGEVELHYGHIYRGRNQDSDYLFDNRRGEFSRSNNGAGGDMFDISASLGVPLALPAVDGWRQVLIPRVGYSLHQQNLSLIDGYQTIPATGAFAGLDSRYATEWNGGWFGVSLISERQHQFRFDLSYHLPDFHAEANWNLRDDLAHPKSFEQWSNGSGVSLGLQLRVPYKQVALIGGYQLRSWQAEAGYHRVYLATGQTGGTRLNEVEWRSQQLSLAVEYLFGESP